MVPSWFSEAETLKTRILDRLEKMSPEDRHLVPRPGEWSAAQVVAHLTLVEEQLVTDWYAAANASPTVRPSPKSALAAGMASFAMKNMPVRVPTFASVDPNECEPDRSGDLSTLSARWASVRERVAGTFPPNAAALWVIHPMFGPLSCRQFGAFLVAHLHHHLKHWPIRK